MLRLCSVLLVAELSGTVHIALDVLESLRGEAHQGLDDCDDEGRECPPGCASCHCWRGAPAVVLTPAACVLTQPLGAAPSESVGFVPYAALAPSGAHRDSVYRPPRATA